MTDSSNIAWLGVQLPVISSMIPSLVLSEIATIQALDRRAGSVFYLDARVGTAKDGLAVGATLLSAKTGHARAQADRVYGSQISSEYVGSTGVAAVNQNLLNLPINAGTVTVTDGVEIWTDNGANVMVSNLSGSTNGTINYTNGALNIVFTSVAATRPVATYTYFYQSPTAPTATGSIVPAVDFNLTAETVTAIDFTLQSKFTLAGALDLKKAHGMDLEAEVVKILGGELRFQADHYGIDKMYLASIDSVNGAGQGTTLTLTPSSGEEFVWKKYQFNDQVEQTSNLIFNKTLRGSGTFIVCGLNVARVIRQLKPDFTAAKVSKPIGPHKIGELNGRTVIVDPFLPTNYYFMGYKGESFIDSSFIFCPYLPLFSTPSLTTSDLVTQKGFMMSAGYKVVNQGLFSGSQIVIA